jgi:hypothetical protein
MQTWMNTGMNKILIKTFVALSVFLIGTACIRTHAQTSAPPTPPAKESAPSHPETISITGAGPRPLSQALEVLRLKYDGAVSYEDPQYLSAKDVKEDPAAKENLVPAGTPFTLQIPPVQSPTDTAAEEKSIQSIVEAYNHSGNPGQFEVRKTEGRVITVVGVAARDDKGSFAPQKPLLDSVLTIPEKDRTITETLDLLCETLAKEGHVPVIQGISPRSLVDQSHVKIGGKLPARSILAQALAASPKPLYWQFFFDPNTKGYILNVHSVHVTKAPAAPKIIKPAAPDAHPSMSNP